MSFKELGLNKKLVKAVNELGFETPMPIQEQAIPVLLAGERDFVGLAQTGTGKTAAFGLPLIQSVDPTFPRPQALIMYPTRELCMQITNDLKSYARFMKKIQVVAVYGGASISNQVHEIRRGAQIIVATPGRLLDLINRKAVKLSDVTHAVLDEADEMLNMGFKEDIDSILDKIEGHRNIWLFSATMPREVINISRNYLVDPVKVTVGGKTSSPENIEHKCFVIQEKDRYHGLKRIIDFTPEIFGLVFCRTRKETQMIAESLMKDGYQAEALHGDLSQSQRDYVMRKFRQKNIRILVATDVAARGLDVDDVSHVIHYRLPDEWERYTHRSGRTARAGKSGASIALISMKETRRIKELEKKRKIKFEFCKIPNGKAICKKQLLALVDKIVQTDVNHEDIADYLPAISEALEGIDKDELIMRFVSGEFNRFLEYYRDAEDINVRANSRKGSKKASSNWQGKKKHSVRGKKKERFFISVGRLDKINEGAIVRLVCEQTGIRSNMIGEIDMNREFSFFEVEQSAAGKIGKSFHNAKLDGRPIQVQKVFKKRKPLKRKKRASAY